MRARINWIDSIRGLAFLMVIYYHLSTRDKGGIVPYFSPVFLTSFFFISGYLTKYNKSFSKVLEQRTRTLFMPLLIFGLGGGVLLASCKFNMDLFLTGCIESLKGVFYQYGKHQTLWFIASLYVYSLIFYWVNVVCKTAKRMFLCCLIMIVINQIVIYNFHCPMLPWKLNYCLWAVAIMGLGKVYREYENRIDTMFMKWYVALPAFFVFIILVFYSHESIVFWGSANWFYAFVIPFTGMIWMLYLSKRIIVNNIPLLYIGANSLIYFALHRQILTAVEAMTKRILQTLSLHPSVWINLCEVILIAALIAVPVWIINKYIPQVTGKGWKLWNTD